MDIQSPPSLRRLRLIWGLRFFKNNQCTFANCSLRAAFKMSSLVNFSTTETFRPVAGGGGRFECAD